MSSSVAAPVTAAGLAMHGRLALAFQEVLTAAARLREGRQVPSDATAFRAHVKGLLGHADQDARRVGYPPEFVKLSVYAVVAFIDETVLATPGPLSAAWTGRPLQEEIFGDLVAGEVFFRNLQDLLARQDSAYVADVLEVHLLCLHLGFRGRYASSDGTDLRSFIRATGDKVLRIRGGFGPLAPRALPPQQEVVTKRGDDLLRKLLLGLAGSAALVAVLIVFFRFFVLLPGAGEITTLLRELGQ